MRLHLPPLIAPLVLVACDGAPSKPTPSTDVCGPDAPRGLEIGDCAPEFALPDATGELVALSSMRGRVALVDISAVW